MVNDKKGYLCYKLHRRMGRESFIRGPLNSLTYINVKRISSLGPLNSGSLPELSMWLLIGEHTGGIYDLKAWIVQGE